MTHSLGADHLRLDEILVSAWVWDPDRARVVDANEAALELWAEPSVADLMDREFDPEGTFANALARGDSGSGTEPEKTILSLPLSSGMRDMCCTLTHGALKDGRRGVLITVLGNVDAGSTEETVRLANAARHAPVALLVVDVDGHITSENAAALDMFGRGRDAVLAQRIGSTRIARALIEETLIHGRASRTRTIPSRIGLRLTRLTARRSEDPLTRRPTILVQAIDVEDQRAREAVLLTQNEALEDFLHASSDFHLELDQDLRVARISASLATMLDLDAGQTIGLHWRDLTGTHGLTTSAEIDMALGARSGWRELPLSIKNVDEATSFATSAHLLTSDKGDFRGYRLVGREIAPPQESAEITHIAPLPAQSSDFAQLVEAAPWAVIIHRDFAPVYANTAFAELFGIDEHLVSEPAAIPLLYFFPDCEPALREDHTGLTAGDLAFAVRELEVRRDDGRTFTIQMRARAIEWRGETAVEYVLEDVSAYRTAQHEGEMRASTMTTLLNRVPVTVLLMDGSGVVEWANLSTHRLLGLADHAPAPHDISDVLCPEDTGWAQDYIAGLAEGGLAHLFAEGREVTVVNASGERIPALMALDRIESGTQIKICAVLRDISQWRQSEADIDDVRDEAETSSSRKTEFLARVSHELRTPLTAILGFAQVMAREEFGPIGNAQYLEYAGDILSSGDHLLSLINDLLDMSKVEAGKLDLSFGSVALSDLATDCVRLMQPIAQGRQIQLRTVFPDGLATVVADKRSLKQILLNLISNALRFTEPGGEVTVSALADENGGLTLSVTDTGVGMSEEELAIALEPFEQVEKAVANGTPGTGLGLPLARALTEANRAYFHINSAPETGTTVAITFPSTQVLAD